MPENSNQPEPQEKLRLIKLIGYVVLGAIITKFVFRWSVKFTVMTFGLPMMIGLAMYGVRYLWSKKK